MIDLADIQCDTLPPYGNAYARTTYVFVTVRDAEQGRAWLSGLVDRVTNDEPWTEGKPETALNLAFTCAGLQALGVPQQTLDSFSSEFRAGMAGLATQWPRSARRERNAGGSSRPPCSTAPTPRFAA